ncbi:MAG: hypothetical protein IT443_11925 [Phycisphaeraceae bacterium]|nr:hypothetical protein [Phycisphaeraceae bacterium]
MDVWLAIGPWALNTVGVLLLTFCAYLFKRIAALEVEIRRLLERQDKYVVLADVERLIQANGNYRDDKAAIALQLEIHHKQLEALAAKTETLLSAQAEVKGIVAQTAVIVERHLCRLQPTTGGSSHDG